MELYLKWLDKYEKAEGELPPVGLILCAESKREQVELLEMHKDGIMVSEYWTELPPKEQLEKKIHSILVEARERMERRRFGVDYNLQTCKLKVLFFGLAHLIRNSTLERHPLSSSKNKKKLCDSIFFTIIPNTPKNANPTPPNHHQQLQNLHLPKTRLHRYKTRFRTSARSYF